LARRLEAGSAEQGLLEHGSDFSAQVEMLPRYRDGVKITCLPHPLVLDSPPVNNI
jgi:hypothetical protein